MFLTFLVSAWMMAGCGGEETTPSPTLLEQTIPTLLASNQLHPHSLVVDSQAVYWANFGTDSIAYTDGAIMTHSKSQGKSRTLVSDLSCPGLLKADSNYLHWLNRQ